MDGAADPAEKENLDFVTMFFLLIFFEIMTIGYIPNLENNITGMYSDYKSILYKKGS